MELRLEKDSHFVNAMEAMLDLVDVASLDCDSTGLKLRAVIDKHIAGIALYFDAKDFQNYSCDGVYSMGIPIDDMVKVIRRAHQDDIITIKVNDENFETITILFESPSQKNTATYNVMVMDDGSHRLDMPDLQDWKLKCQAFVEMPSAEFMRVCKSLSNISGDGHIAVTEKDLKFFASGESGHVNIKYIRPATVVTYNVEAPVSLTLDMMYMYSIAKVYNLFDQVEIYISTTEPLMVQCKIRQESYIRFVLAPKVKRETEINGSGEEDRGIAEINGSGEGRAATLLLLKLEEEKEKSLFLNALEAMLHLVPVASVNCSSTGLQLRAVDPNDIAVFALILDVKDFQKYCCNKVLSMGIPINDIVKAIGCAHKDNTITIKVDCENSIAILFESPSQNNTTTFDFPVVDDSSHHFYVQDWQDLKLKYQAFVVGTRQDFCFLKTKYQACVEMPSAEFMRVCKHLRIIGGDGHISVTKKALKFFSSGEGGCVNIKYMQPDTVVTYTIEAPVSLTLDMEYLYSIAKVSTLFDQVEICLAATQLLMVQCKIKQMSYIRFFLAPKVIRDAEFAEIQAGRQRRKESRETEGVEGIGKKAKIKLDEETDTSINYAQSLNLDATQTIVKNSMFRNLERQ